MRLSKRTTWNLVAKCDITRHEQRTWCCQVVALDQNTLVITASRQKVVHALPQQNKSSVVPDALSLGDLFLNLAGVAILLQLHGSMIFRK